MHVEVSRKKHSELYRLSHVNIEVRDTTLLSRKERISKNREFGTAMRLVRFYFEVRVSVLVFPFHQPV